MTEREAAAAGALPVPSAEDPAATRPFYRLLGLVSEPGAPKGESRLRIGSRPDFENSRGDFHGGVVAALLDAAMGVAVRSAYPDGEGATTVTLTINYIQPGRGALLGSGKVVRAGRTIASAEANVTDAAGSLVAHAIGTMRIIRKTAG